MPITKVNKTFEEIDLIVSPFQKVSEIVAPAGEFQVVGFLPVALGREDGVNKEYWTIEAGRMVAFTGTDSSPRFTDRITLANGGNAASYTYATADIGRTEDIDNPGNLVTGTGLATADDPINFPIGIAPYPYYQGTLKDRLRNYELQPYVAIWNTAYVEEPVLFDEQDTGATALNDGVLLMPGDQGQLMRWQDGSDSVEHLCGRCWRVDAIGNAYPRGGLDKVHTQLGLSGSATGGIPAHLNITHVDDAVTATIFFRAVINAAP